MLNTFQTNNCHYYFNDLKVFNNTQICNDTWSAINTLAGGLNWYDLFRRTYPDDIALPLLKDANRLGESIVDGETKTYVRGMTMKEYTPWAKHIPLSENDPVLGGAFSDYLNRPDVRKALNIPTTLQGWT